MEQLPYLVKVNLYWLLFYACYWLFFRKHTFFRLNRVYLVGTLCLAMVLPAIEFAEPVKVLPAAVVSNIIAKPELTITPENMEREFSWTSMMPIIYLAGVLIMLFKFLEGLYRLKQLIGKSECIDLERFKLVLLPDHQDFATGSFSFFSYLIVSRNDYENHFQTILEHEEVHIRQWHSVDIVLIEILKIIFWFNPALWLYKLALREIHEYLADEQATNRDSYASFLVLYAKNAAIRSISNQFYNSSLLKDRIKMIYKGRTSRWFRGKYLLMIPLVAVLVMMTAARKQAIEQATKPAVAAPDAFRSSGKKGKTVVSKEYTVEGITIRSKKAKVSGKRAAGQSVGVKKSKGVQKATEQTVSAEKKELRQFSHWNDGIAPKNPFVEKSENNTFQNYAFNYSMIDYSGIIPRRLTVIEPPKLKFYRYGYTTRPPVLRSVNMKSNLE